MTDQELKDLVASLTVKHAELAESTARSREETDRQLRELGKQIGGLGDKFGSFTEGLALPSMTKILTNRFHMGFIAPYVKRRQNGRTMELDVLAYSNAGLNEAYVVEVKSHLRQEAIDQMKQILRDFREFFPEHADKKVYGILAAVDAPDKIQEQVVEEGIYMAKIHDGQFELQVPEDFQPRSF